MATHTLMKVVGIQADHNKSWREHFNRELPELQPRPKAMLLGLPCSRCGAYYAAELDACPICGCTERISPARPKATVVM